MSENETQTLTGKIVKTFYSSPEFTPGIIKTAEGKYRFRGKFLVEDGETVTMQGQFVQDAKYGEQFNATALIYDQPIDSAGLANYLANCPTFKGLGKVKAARIADLYGEAFEGVLVNTPCRIVKSKLITQEQVMSLRDEWMKRGALNALSTWLAGYGLTHCQLQRLVNSFGANAVQVLRSNPYELCNVRGFGFARADEIAMKFGVAKDSTERIRACLLQILADNEEAGHCWIDGHELVSVAVTELFLDNPNPKDLIVDVLDKLNQENEVVFVGNEHKNYIGKEKTYEREYAVLSAIDTYASQQTDNLQLQYVVDFCDSSLNDSQSTALRMALASRISAMCGSAGTGKTFTIKAVTDALRAMGKSFALAAPTGKAAKRITESTGLPASTIHRLLEYNPQLGWLCNRDSPLEYDFIIIDESSMIDVSLMYHLFDAIDFSASQLLLVGDDSQLLPVGVGCPFHDILQREICPVTRLTQIVRQAGILKENSLGILNGTLAPTTPGESGVLRPWYCFAKYESSEELRERLTRFIRDEASQKLGLDILTDICILAPQNKGDIGVLELNKMLQEIVQREVYDNELPQEKRKKFYQGDRIMQTRNSYSLGEHGVMNGETGIIEEVSSTIDDNRKTVRKLMIRLDNGEKLALAENDDELKSFELAYVLSVHKSQGSQYRMVIPIVHSAHSFSLTRNLFYTAVTRAQESVMILGNAKGIRKALADTSSAERNTWMSVL